MCDRYRMWLIILFMSEWKLFKTLEFSLAALYSTQQNNWYPLSQIYVNCDENFKTVLKDKMSRTEISSLRKLSTIFEWKEDDHHAARQTKTRQSETALALRRSLTANERKDSRMHDHDKGTANERKNRAAKFPEVQQAASSGCPFESPLKGTPWEEAGLRSVSSGLSYSSSQRRNQGNLRTKRSAKEQECIDLWLKFLVRNWRNTSRLSLFFSIIGSCDRLVRPKSVWISSPFRVR